MQSLEISFREFTMNITVFDPKITMNNATIMRVIKANMVRIKP